ncbi:MAG: hypothetical protein ACREIW_10300 [Chthoniobacterales bacterium]
MFYDLRDLRYKRTVDCVLEAKLKIKLLARITQVYAAQVSEFVRLFPRACEHLA